MSLRNHIYLRILLSSLGILLLGGSLVIWQARNAVEREIDSSINLALQLVRFGFSETRVIKADWLNRFKLLNETRHLNIQVEAPSGEKLSLTSNRPATQTKQRPPRWFVHLVGGRQNATKEVINTSDGRQYRLIIQANPLDEITEVWQESSVFLGLILSLTVLTFLAVHLAFSHSLKTIGIIVNNLKSIEKGDYQLKLPTFSTQEYDQIAKAINHMNEVLYKTQLDNRSLTQHSLAIQEDERQRLAQELHDELGQSLTAIKIMAATLAHRAVDIQQVGSSIVDICDHLVCVVRSMMYQLHPLVLTDLGLKAALEDLLNHWSSKFPQLQVDLTCPDEADRLDPKITIQIYRIIQECLTNIIRHAEADKASIALSLENMPEKRVLMKVSDNGRGCEIDRQSSGFGLLGMKERVHSLGGDFAIISRQKCGMVITANIPLS